MNTHTRNGESFGDIQGLFPIYQKSSKPLHYLDSAASAFKPKSVIDRLTAYYSFEHANIHRGAYELSANATNLYDNAREVVAAFINAEARELVFTAGTTAGINLVASATRNLIKAGEVILLSLLEHHSNIVPWQLIAKITGARLEYIQLTADGELDYQDAQKKIKAFKPKLVAVTGMSNALGFYTEIKKIVPAAKEVGVMVLIDAAQLIAHRSVDVKELGVDFLVFSGHKLYGPTGIGALYINKQIVDRLEPYQGGGDMISEVTTNGSTWAEPPNKFEAGTPPIAQAIGLAEAVRFFLELNPTECNRHEEEVVSYGVSLLRNQAGVKLYGAALLSRPTSIAAFNLDGVHPHDLSTVCDEVGVQIRAGTHCAMPALKRLGLQATARASSGVYSRKEDFDALIEGIKRAQKLFT